MRNNPIVIDGLRYLFIGVLLVGLFFYASHLSAQNASAHWKANVAKVDITPKVPMWMAGIL